MVENNSENGRYEIAWRTAFNEQEGSEKRCEVQVVRPVDDAHAPYELRVCYYQENGRFGYAPPTIPGTAETVEAFQSALSDAARECQRLNAEQQAKRITDAADDVSTEAAADILDHAASIGPEKALSLLTNTTE